MPSYKNRKDGRTTVWLQDKLHAKMRAIAFFRGPEMTLAKLLDEIVAEYFKNMPIPQDGWHEKEDASGD